jgi:hypothetical protein
MIELREQEGKKIQEEAGEADQSFPGRVFKLHQGLTSHFKLKNETISFVQQDQSGCCGVFVRWG